MPTDANGVYSLPPGYLATPNTPILTSQHNPIFEDVAQALTDRLPRNGSAPMTGELTLSSDNPAGSLSAVPKIYVDKKGPVYWGGTSTGSANAQAVATILSASTLAPGTRISFIPGFTNTLAVTLAVDSVPALAVKKLSPSGLLALSGREMIAGQVSDVIYDGTQYVLMNNAQRDGRPTSITASITLTTSDIGRFLIFNSATTVTLTLPAAPTNGSFTIWNNSAVIHNLSIPSGIFNGPGGSGSNALVVQPGESLILASDGTNWTVFSRYTAQQGIWAPGTLRGLELSLDTATSIGIAAGNCRNGDSGQPFNMTLAAAITKTFSNFAAGSGNGGLDTGTIAANTWYHVHLIRKDADGTLDAVISLSATAPTMPAGYTARRRLGAIRTNASSQVTPFTQVGDDFFLGATLRDVAAVHNTTSAVLYALTVPPLASIIANGDLVPQNTSTFIYGMLTSPYQPDEAPSEPNGPVSPGVNFIGGSSSNAKPQPFSLRVNSSGQVRVRTSTASSSTTIYIFTYGWTDNRGKG